MKKLLVLVLVVWIIGSTALGSSFWFGLENYQGWSSISLGGFVALDPFSLRGDVWIGQDACALGISMGLCTFRQGLVEARTGWAVSLEQAKEVYFLAGPFLWLDFLFGNYGWIELEGNLWAVNLESCCPFCLWGFDAKALGWLAPYPEIFRVNFFIMHKTRPAFSYREGRFELVLNIGNLCDNPSPCCCLPDLPLWLILGYKQAMFNSPRWAQLWRGPIWGVMIKDDGWEASLSCHHLISFSPDGQKYDPRIVLQISINF